MEKLGAISLSSDILEKANIGLWAFELDEGSEPRMYADAAMMKLIGLKHAVSPEETYHAWYDHIDPEHYGEVAAAVEQMTAGVHAEVQYPWHCPCGDTWIVRCGGVRNYAYTKGIRIEGTHQNISAMMHHERKNLTDLLASLSDNFMQVCFLDPYTGDISYLAGHAPGREDSADAVNANFYQDLAERGRSVVHPDDWSLAEQMCSRENLIDILTSGKPSEFTVRFGSGADCVYMKTRLVPYEDSDGTKKLVIGTLDVTEEVAAEKALEERNAYLEHFLDGFQSAYVVDLAEDSFSILSMKHDFSDFFMANGSRSDMNAFIKDHIHPDDRELMLQMSDNRYLRSLLEKQSEISFTAREVYGEIEKTMRVQIMRGADSSRAAVGFMDITDEIAREKDRSRKLEEASRAKSDFLFNMSHDIRTPMNAIIGFTAMARAHLDDAEKVDDCLGKVESSSKHLLSLINDVLDMSRIESGKTDCQYAPTKISASAENILNMVRESSGKNLKFTGDFSGVEHDWVLADSLHVNRIITNIIGNAVKYTNEGGTVDYTIREMPTAAENRYAYDFIISDSGIGMSEEFQQHIFEEFARERTSTVSGVQGTGLGMAITKKLVDLLGGKIAIQSKLGEGTKVTVHLEMEAIAPDAVSELTRPNVADASILNGKKILLVEDNELNREIARDLLEDSGAEVDEAEDGDIAVEKMRNAEKGRYDLIFMDVQMPRMDGYTATRAIRNLPDPEAADIPIVAMTANAFEEDRQNALNAGMNGHVAKPIDVPKLLRTLAEIMN